MGVLADLAAQRARDEIDQAANPVLNQTESLVSEDRTITRLNAASKLDADPAMASRVLKMEARTGFPTDFIERNIDLVEKEAASADFSAKDFEEKSPVYAEWVAKNPNHLAATKDDVENLQGMEWFLKAPFAAHEEGVYTVEKLRILDRILLDDNPRPEDEARLLEINKLSPEGRSFGAEGTLEDIWVESFRLLPTMEYVGIRAAKGSLAYGGLAGAAGLLTGPGAPIAAPSLYVSGAAVGGTIEGVKASMELSGGEAYGEFRGIKDINGDPIDDYIARGAAKAYRVLGGILESFGIYKVGKHIPGVNKFIKQFGIKGMKKLLSKPTFRKAISKYAMRWAESTGSEVTTEVLQEGVMMAILEIAKSLDSDEFESITSDEVISRLEEVAVKTLQGTLIIGGIGPTAQFSSDAAKVRKANDTKAIFEAIDGTAEKSTTRKNLPKQFKDFVDRVSEKGGIKEVGIPIERFDEYYQEEGIDPAEAAREITGNDKAYEEAKATGGDILIKTSDYASNIAGTEQHAGLIDDLRLGEDEFTAREAEEWRSNSAQILKELSEGLPDSEKVSSQAVYDDVLGQMLANNEERGMAETNATLMAEVLGTLGQRTGIDPMRLLYAGGETSLQIKRELPEAIRNMVGTDIDIDPYIDALLTGTLPSDQDMFGPSLMQFIDEKGGLAEGDSELEARDLQNEFVKGRGEKGVFVDGKKQQLRDRPIIREFGKTADELAGLAAEAGFISAHDLTEFMEAIDSELSGTPVFSVQNEALPGGNEAREFTARVGELDRALTEMGIDVTEEGVTNETIKAAILEQVGGGLEAEQLPLEDFTTQDLSEDASLQNEGEGFTIQVPEASEGGLKRTHIAVAKRGDVFQIFDASVIDELQGQGIGQQLIMLAAEEAAKRGGSLISDTVVSVAQLRVYEALKRKGWEITYEEPAVVANALETKEAVFSVTTQNTQPVVKTIKPPAGVAEQKQTGAKGPRGTYSFSKNIITLLERKNLSTFLHESGHFYLEVMGSIIQSGQAPQQMIDDIGVLQEWFSSTSEKNWEVTKERVFTLSDRLDADPENKTLKDELAAAQAAVRYADQNGGAKYIASLDMFGPITGPHDRLLRMAAHEQFARGFEAYLREGKAPSEAVRSAFVRFRVWLENVYEKLTQLNVDLTPEVRGVMDRMVATDDAIKAARDSQERTILFSDPEVAGMTPEQFELYRKRVTNVRNTEQEKLLQKLLAVEQREQLKWWKSERKRIKDEVTAEVQAMPVYRVMAFLRTGKNPDGSPSGITPVKLSKKSIIRAHGEEFLKRLSRPYVYSLKGGVDQDIVAAMFGYSDGKKMMQDIANAQRIKDVIEAETNRRMDEAYPDPATDGSIAEEAMNTIHRDESAELLNIELMELRRLARGDKAALSADKKAKARQKREAKEEHKADLRMIRAAVEMMIGGMPIHELSPSRFRIAEAKAARMVRAALERGDYDKAYRIRKTEIFNHEAYRVAEKTIKETQRTQRYFSKFAKRRVREKLGKAGMGLLEKIEATLAQISLKKTSVVAITRNKAKAELLQQITDGSILAPDSVIQKLQADSITNWRELTVDELRGMRDIILQLEQQAKNEAEAVVNGEKVLINDAAEAVAASITNNNKSVPRRIGSPTRADKRKKSFKQGIDTWLRPGAIARLLDGDREFGEVTKTLIITMRRAVVEKLVPMERQAREDVSKLYRDSFTDAELNELSKQIDIEELGGRMTRGDLLSLALNMGNEGNKLALINSKYNGEVVYTAEGLQQALGRLTSKEWDFVISVREYIDSYWGDVKDSNGKVIRQGLSTIEKQRRGIAPEKVEASPFSVTTSDGVERIIPGGYYPLKYDGDQSTDQQANDVESEFTRFMNSTFITQTTRAGATYDRRGSGGRVVRLGLNLIDQHLHEIIRDIAIGNEARFVHRIINHRSVKGALQATGNIDTLRTLNEWLQDAAIGEIAAIGGWNRLASRARIGFTVSKLAWNMVTVTLQITGLAQTVPVIGVESFSAGVGKWMSNPLKWHKAIMENSAFMKARYEMNTWNKDVADTKAYLEESFGGIPSKYKTARNALAHSYFWPIARMQQIVDEITYMGAMYRGAKKLNLDGDELIHYAESIVENSQTSGLFSDRSAIERGSMGGARQQQYIKVWTTLISYMLAKGNIAYEATRGTIRKPTIGSVTNLAGVYVMLFTIEAIASAAIRGRLPDFDEDDEDKDGVLMWLFKETAASAGSGIPVFREFFSARYGSGNTPLGTIPKDLYSAMVQSEQGEFDPALFKSWNNFLGAMFGYPSTFMNRMYDGWHRDNIDEEDVPLIDYFTGERNREE